jgi:hypothetical protein
MRGLCLGTLGVTVGVVVSAAQGRPVYQPDWTADTNEMYGGRSRVEDGAFRFWTDTPLATPVEDVDDQVIYYYGGYVPTQGPYALEATVDLPGTNAAPYRHDWDLVSYCQLGLVASGLLTTNLGTDNLPALGVGVVYEDVTVGGVVYGRGDRFLTYEAGNDPVPVRLGGPGLDRVLLRAAFDGTHLLQFAYRLEGDAAWTAVADVEVRERGGLSSRAELRGEASNLLLPEAEAGAVSDFRVRQPYVAWLDEMGVPEADRGEGADPEGDGLKNLEEYALALHPLEDDAAGWLTLRAQALETSTEVILTHRHSRTACVEFDYEGTTSFQAWDLPLPPGTRLLVGMNPGGDGRADVYDTSFLTPARSLALRLRVLHP